MAVINCGVCGKRMPTEKVLTGHLKKAHSNLPETSEPKEETKEQKEEAKKIVKIVSLDPKKPLQVSIGDKFWDGLTIEVEHEFSGEVIRLLTDGGYYFRIE